MKRKYTINEQFFNRINSEEKAYWLGFITADGNICENRLTLCLAKRDKGHLEKFKVAIGSTHPLREYVARVANKEYPTIGWVVYSKKLTKALMRLGVSAKKSLTVKPCTRVPDRLLAHYWRGVFDGDGCISWNTQHKTPQARLNLVGNEFIVTAFLKFVPTKTKKSISVYRQKNAAQLNFGGSRLSRKILRALKYNSARISLDRKQKTANEVLNTVDVYPDWTGYPLALLDTAYEELGSWRLVAKSLGTSRGTVRAMRKRALLAIAS